MTDALVFIDTETTGLDPRIHQPYEVSWWREGKEAPSALWLPHTLDLADPKALAIGGYWERGGEPLSTDSDWERRILVRELRGATLVNVSEGAMWIFGWDRPRGLASTAEACRAEGYDIPEPDHTAEGDVRTTRAVYHALRDVRSRM